MAELDINAVVQRGSLKVDAPETPEELTARVKAESRAKLLADIRGMAVFCVILLVLLVLGGLCAWEVFFDPKVTPETLSWARAALASLITSSITFVMGHKIGEGARKN